MPEDEKVITGMYFDRIPTNASLASALSDAQGPERQRYFVIITTLHRIHQFVGDGGSVRGDSIFEPIFARYANPCTFFMLSDLTIVFQELPGDMDHGALHILKSTDALRAMPKAFAWMTGAGVYYGDIVMEYSKENVIENAQLLPYAVAYRRR
jgi:hypothetical protein